MDICGDYEVDYMFFTTLQCLLLPEGRGLRLETVGFIPAGVNVLGTSWTTLGDVPAPCDNTKYNCGGDGTISN